MAIVVNGIVTSLEETEEDAQEKALRLLGLQRDQVLECCVAKTSLDARRRGNIHFVHSVSVSLEQGEDKAASRCGGRAVLRKEAPLQVKYGNSRLPARPVIAGFGPAGMFAGLLLARHGYQPLILERGARMERRVQQVEQFWHTGKLDPETNVQFGEGGAGTFSDGKLTTRIGDDKCAWVLRELVRFGAPPEIRQKAKPHVGTDLLRGIVCAIREEIIRLGGEIRFETPLTGVECAPSGKLKAVSTPEGKIPAEAFILAVGHSAREMFTMLEQAGLPMQAKPFSVGVRIEHLQSGIDKGLYGDLAGHPMLPKGEYQLSLRLGDRGVYTFCMCPGGVVVPAASQEGMVVTNGMSYHARDGLNANSAVVVSVSPEDYGNAPLDGMRFQQALERAAYSATKGTYQAPAQDTGSFLDGRAGLRLGRVVPSYSLGVQEGDFSMLFPPFVTGMLQKGIRHFSNKLPGFAIPDAILTGVETRTSSPVRILRGEDFQSPGFTGIYPCAEGAGYAGGIMSAAVDGLRVAMALMGQYAPLGTIQE